MQAFCLRPKFWFYLYIFNDKVTGVTHQKPGTVENLLDSSSPGPELETPDLMHIISLPLENHIISV